MELIGWYLLFASATSITALYELLYPVMKTLKNREPDNIVVKNIKWTYIVSFLFYFIAAPLIIFPTLNPKMGDWMRLALEESLSEPLKI